MTGQAYDVILVGVDGSDQAFEAFKKAVAVGKRNGGKVICAHIIENRVYGMIGYTAGNEDLMRVETEKGKKLLEEYKAYAASELDYHQVDGILTFGSPKVLMATELPEKYQVSLIMVGQSGLNTAERLIMGSVCDYVIRHAVCDVLVVRPEN